MIIAVANNNQQTTTDKQANHYWTQVSQEQWKPQQTEYTHDNSSMLTLFLLFYVWTSNGLICGYITIVYDKRIVTSCVTWHLPQSIRILRLSSSTLSADYSMIIYAANNSQLMLIIQKYLYSKPAVLLNALICVISLLPYNWSAPSCYLCITVLNTKLLQYVYNTYIGISTQQYHYTFILLYRYLILNLQKLQYYYIYILFHCCIIAGIILHSGTTSEATPGIMW